MLTGILVHEAMTHNPIYVKVDDDLVKCAKSMLQHKIGALLVKDAEKVIGICTEQDLVRKVIAQSLDPAKLKISEIMDKNLKTINAEKDIFEAMVKMREFGIRHLPVVDGDKFVGLLTMKDILKIEPQLFELLVDKLDIKEAERKPVKKLKSQEEGICPLCGNYSDTLTKNEDGVLVCEVCINE